MASGGNLSKKRMIRFSDIAQEPLATLMSISDYEKKELVSLETSVVPLQLIIPGINERVKEAKRKYSNTSPPQGLKIDEAASILLYTMEWHPHEQSPYSLLNATLRSKDRTKLGSWLLYLKLLLTALNRLPSTHRFLFRGIKSDIHNDYRKNQMVTWWGLTSCTMEVDVLETFLGMTGARTMFTIDCNSGKDISSYSEYPFEKEVLLLPETQFKVIASLNQGNGLYTIQLQEIQSPLCISKPIAEVRLLSCGGPACSTCGKCKDWYRQNGYWKRIHGATCSYNFTPHDDLCDCR